MLKDRHGLVLLNLPLHNSRAVKGDSQVMICPRLLSAEHEKDCHSHWLALIELGRKPQLPNHSVGIHFFKYM